MHRTRYSPEQPTFWPTSRKTWARPHCPSGTPHARCSFCCIHLLIRKVCILLHQISGCMDQQQGYRCTVTLLFWCMQLTSSRTQACMSFKVYQMTRICSLARYISARRGREPANCQYTRVLHCRVDSHTHTRLHIRYSEKHREKHSCCEFNYVWVTIVFFFEGDQQTAGFPFGRPLDQPRNWFPQDKHTRISHEFPTALWAMKEPFRSRPR